MRFNAAILNARSRRSSAWEGAGRAACVGGIAFGGRCGTAGSPRIHILHPGTLTGALTPKVP